MKHFDKSIAAFLGLSAIGLGAFAAHALKGSLEPAALQWMDTATRYQLLHALACLWCVTQAGKLERLAGRLFLVGAVLFSGSLYAMALGSPKWLGAVTPLGGVCLMAGWLMILISGLKANAS